MSNNKNFLSDDFSMNNITEEQKQQLFKVEMDAKAIPDLNKLLISIYKLLEDIETKEMQELEKTNKKEFEKVLTHKYYEDIQSNKIINLMLDKDRYNNLSKLLDMFERLEKVKSGKEDINNAHKQWCEKMNEEYIYSKHGGKEEFEKKMLKKK